MSEKPRTPFWEDARRDAARMRENRRGTGCALSRTQRRGARETEGAMPADFAVMPSFRVDLDETPKHRNVGIDEQFDILHRAERPHVVDRNPLIQAEARERGGLQPMCAVAQESLMNSHDVIF